MWARIANPRYLELSDGRRIKIAEVVDSSDESLEVPEKLYTKDEIKGFLRDMLNERAYSNQRSAINSMLYNMDDKSVEDYNNYYQYIKNKDVLKEVKTA